MKYQKQPLTFEEQADLIISRGLTVDNRDKLTKILQTVNYYRLSAYWYPFKQADESLQAGTTFDKIWKRYVFDRQLRLLVMDAIERVEIAVRTSMVNIFSLKYGASGYLDITNFSAKYNPQSHQRFLNELKRNTDRSSEEFVRHFKNRYDEESDLPLWMISELMTFGNMFSMFRGMEKYLQKELAITYNIPSMVLESWLQTLNYVRNLCAHHARLWNRELAIKPFIPYANKYPDWHSPVVIQKHRIFSVLTLLQYMLSFVAPNSQWKCRLEQLLKNYNDIPIVLMGFPENWQKSPIWREGEVV